MANSKGKCKYCKEYFYKSEGVQLRAGFFCSFDHASRFGLEKSISDSKKAFKKDIAERRKKLKTLTDYANEAQTAVNAYVRERDRGKPCISCDRPDLGDHQRHASHYRPRGARSELRFNLLNIHASCATCNNHHSGNLIEYRIRLIEKIGAERVEWLECKHEIRKYSKEYLERIKRIFNKKTRQLKKRREQNYREAG